MPKFLDSNDQEWTMPALSDGLIEDLKEQTDIDFYEVLRDQAKFAEIVFTVRSIGKVLWVLMQKQIKERGLDHRGFAYLLDGPTAERAGLALMESIADFSPRSKVGQWLKTNLRAMTDEMDQKIVAALEKQYGGLPASSA